MDREKFNALVRDFKSGMIRDPVVRVVRPDSDDPQQMLLKGNERALEFLGSFQNFQIVGDAFRSISQAVVGHQNFDTVFRQAAITLMRQDPARYNTRFNYDEIEYSTYLDRLEKDGEAVGWDVIQAAADLLQARIIETFANGSIMMRETDHEEEVFWEINILSNRFEE